MDAVGDRAAHRPGGPYRRPGAAPPRRFARAPPAEDLIQVYYPHLRDTVELLQVRRVLRRLNRFLRFIHRGESAAGTDGRAIDAARALLDELEDMPPIQGELESAFPIEPRSGWLEGARRRRRSFFSPHGSSVRQELIDDALARLLVFPHAGLDLLNRDRRSNKTKLSCFYTGRHPAVVSQGDRLAHLERAQESTVRSDLERLRPDCTGVRFGRSGSGGSRRLVVALLPVLILSAGRVPVAVLGYVTFDDFAAFCTTTFLTGDFRSMGCFTYSSRRYGTTYPLRAGTPRLRIKAPFLPTDPSPSRTCPTNDKSAPVSGHNYLCTVRTCKRGITTHLRIIV